ncbi:MAG TPA: ABC transporter permease [Solirubrobacteraceae bacterium]
MPQTSDPASVKQATAAPVTAAATVLAPVSARLGRIARGYSFAFSGLLAGALLIATLIQDHGNFGLTNQLADAAPLIIAALASAPTIIGGGFDLSISPLMFFTNAAYVVWLAPHGLGGAVSIPIVLGLGVASGVFTGLTITWLRVQPVVVTLAMYFALQGVNLLLAPNPVSMSHVGWISHLTGTIAGIPGGVFTIGLPMLIWFGLRFVPFRRLLYAVGSNDATAFSSGVNVASVRVASYALGGLFAGIGGLALTSLVQSTNASQSTEFTLVAIAAVVLGGTSLAGGRGGLLGVLFGGAAIYLLQNLLATIQVNQAWLQIVYGGILIAAVVIQGALVPETRLAGIRLKRSPVWHHSKRRTPTSLLAGLDRLDLESAGNGAGTTNGRAALSDQAPGAEVTGHTSTEALQKTWATLKSIQARYPLIQIVALIAVFVYGALTLPGLASWISIRSILVLAALVGLASGGQTLLILMGGFDLGVAGFIVTGALTVTALSAKYHITFVEALLCALAGSAVLGGLAGYICHRFRINPLVVTLAMGTVALGIVELQSGGNAEYANAPGWLTTMAEPAAKTFGVGLPPPIAIWILVLILFAVFLYRTKIGRNLFATGANPRAADYALINTRRVWIGAFAFSAATAALVGVLIAGFDGTVVTTIGDPYLFQSVVAVIVGGTVFGGPGDYTRTSIGALFLTVLVTVLIGHGASAATEEIVYGVIILIAVATYGRERRLRDRL